MGNTSQIARIGREDAKELLRTFLPMFDWLHERDVDYCLVGGLGVLAHALRAGEADFRVTVDSDLMFDESFTNADFARAYLEVYASNPSYGAAVYEAVFGKGALEELETEVQALVNASFVGADEDLDGVSTPDFDVVRNLNGLELKELEREEVDVLGHRVTVATTSQLLVMKERTIELLHADFETTSRPQDFIDAARLRSLIESARRR